MKKCCKNCEHWLTQMQYSGMISEYGYCRKIHERKKEEHGEACHDFDPLNGEREYI